MGKPLFIYVVTHPKFGNNKVKIGRTYSTEARLGQYNTGCPDKGYKCEFSMQLPEITIYSIERHFLGNVERSNGEWFNVPPETAKEIILDIVQHPEIFQCEENTAKRLSVWEDYPIEINAAVKLKKIRLGLGKTQRQFAEVLGIKRCSLGAYEEGRAKPSLKLVLKIAQEHNIGLGDFHVRLPSRDDRFMFELFNKYRGLKGREKRIVDFALGFDA